MKKLSIPLLAIVATTMFAATTQAQALARFDAYGTGCSSSSTQPPVLTSSGPVVNKIFEVKVQNVQPSSVVLVIVGLSDQAWSSLNITLPMDLTFLGAPGCNLYASGECLAYCQAPPTGTFLIRAGVPNDPRLIGLSVYMQVAREDPTANQAGVAFSAGYKALFGG